MKHPLKNTIVLGTLFASLFFVVLMGLGASFAHATGGSTGFTALAPIPNLTQGVTADNAGLQNFLKNLYFYCIGIAAILAVFQIMRGGVMIAMNRDSVGNLISGKGYITQSLFGLVLVLAPALVFSIINPSILNLSVAIPKLDTAWTTWAPPAAPQTIQINQKSNDIGGQVSAAEQICLKKGVGWTVKINDNALATPSGVTCVPPLPSAGASVTFAQCQSEPGYIQGNAQQGSTNCDNVGVKQLIQSGGYICSPLAGGGYCLHK